MFLREKIVHHGVSICVVFIIEPELCMYSNLRKRLLQKHSHEKVGPIFLIDPCFPLCRFSKAPCMGNVPMYISSQLIIFLEEEYEEEAPLEQEE
jgi:hypothetical protein